MSPDRIARFYWKWHVELGLLIVTIGLALGFLWLISLARQGDEAHQAVCALRHDLVIREKQSEHFLHAYPNGAFGFTASQIQQGITNQQRTIDALRGLRC